MERYADVGLVLEGGGFRGIYTAAVLDVFHREQLFFDYAVAVSAGAAYGVSYVSRQYGRNLDVNPYISDKRYCSLNNLIRKGNYFDWDFVYHYLPTTKVLFDYESFAKSTTRMKVVVTNCHTGAAEYKDFNEASPESFRDLLAATSSLPFISKMQQIGNQRYLDGGIADSIPFKKAFADGKERAIVILTRHAGYRKEPIKGKLLLKLAYRNYPNVVKAIIDRSNKYNQALEELERLEAEGKVFVIRPEQPIAVSRLENNPENLARAYEVAVKEAEQILPKLKNWLDGK
ncbi:patatin family protein [uncultured Acetobacteroides sp.]|uniref:patatin-like phospholipase family protein n=1 Tax=uncultured Acetobacteroides sp. TaxID=1760811 RepID=UPI0029F4A56D|nr:patatin family protein [uncultured Acetobacteroides sp.]